MTLFLYCKDTKWILEIYLFYYLIIRTLYNLECETLAAGVVKIKIEIPNKI